MNMKSSVNNSQTHTHAHTHTNCTEEFKSQALWVIDTVYSSLPKGMGWIKRKVENLMTHLEYANVVWEPWWLWHDGRRECKEELLQMCSRIVQFRFSLPSSFLHCLIYWRYCADVIMVYNMETSINNLKHFLSEFVTLNSNLMHKRTFEVDKFFSVRTIHWLNDEMVAMV